jgi:signal transduction histidine kinase
LAVSAQGGKIWIETAMGKGTTVHFSLPGRANVATSAAAISEPA